MTNRIKSLCSSVWCVLSIAEYRGLIYGLAEPKDNKIIEYVVLLS
jgi:hypothetical protein